MKKLLTSAVLSVSLCTTVAAQTPTCAPVARGAEILQEGFGESLLFSAVLDSGSIIEIWANLETGTWSLVGNDGNMRCLLASGEDHQYTPLGVGA